MRGSPRKSNVVENTAKANSEYSLQLNRWFLKPVGAWPSIVMTRTEKILTRALIFVCCTMISITLVPCVLNMLYEEENKQLRVKAMGAVGHWLMGGINYCSLLLHGGDIIDCMEHIATDWKIVTGSEHRRIMLRHAEIGRFIAGFCAMFMHGSTLSYSIVRGIDIDTAVIGNETIASCFVVNSTTVGACSLAAVFAMHACGQLHVLMSRLKDLVRVDEEDVRFSEKRLAIIVEHHLRVLRFVRRIEDIMNQVCLVEVLGGTLHMCILGYFIITGWDRLEKRDILAYVIMYISMSFNIFIFCFIGELLAEKCEKISEFAYMTDWYRLPRSIALGLILIISRSNVIPRITAGKIIQLSIVTFGDAVRTSVVYINMLRTMVTSNANVHL